MDTRLAEQMALSVLRGDMSAAMALADLLSENRDAVEVEPLIKIDVPLSRIRILLLADSDYNAQLDEDATREAIRQWLHEPYRPLLLTGVRAMQIYQLPE
jgi:hypothetical protein